jgi:asparagine N-glycosylation enzyme membrane subunit Stt3
VDCRFSFFFDLHILACVFPVGLWYCIKNINDERVFIVLYAVSAVYFAGVMVRLMLTLTPCVCVLAAIAFSKLFELYLKDEEPPTAGDGQARCLSYQKFQILVYKYLYVTCTFYIFVSFNQYSLVGQVFSQSF